MHLFTRNVGTAFKTLVEIFQSHQTPGPYTKDWSHKDCTVVREATRNGPVLRIAEPVTITYERPRERVLFNIVRDCNPGFHLYEALWMLAGRNDVAPLAYYNKQMREYSDDGGTLNGAYGHRWRHAHARQSPNRTGPGQVDQLDAIVHHLSRNPTSRRAVLTMWNTEDDLLKAGDHPERSGNFYNKGLPLPASKDISCNLNVMFALRTIRGPSQIGAWDVLDMTVTNRSNDMIWGTLGANHVHFSILQEYVAARLGAEVGLYHHFTNNLHVYETNWKPAEWLAEYDDGGGYYYSNDSESMAVSLPTVPLVKDPAVFEEEVREVVSWYDGTQSIEELFDKGPRDQGWTEPFLEEVAGRMFAAFALHKHGDSHGAIAVIADCPADDWRLAAEGWLRRRIKK